MYLRFDINSLYVLSILYSSLFFSFTSSEKDITINVLPGKEECFYETLKYDQVLDIEYQVIDGGQGALDISFYLMDPDNRLVVMDYKKTDKSHRIEIKEDGDYKLCFDNTFSSFNAKTIYFALVVEAPDGTDVDFGDNFNNKLMDYEQYEMTIQDIGESVNKIKTHLTKVRYLQELVRAFATRDKNILEGNYSKINSWSLLQIGIMITVGFIQVIMVKSLFDEKSKIHKIWKKTFS